MLETILILLFSLALFAYWFRYTVVLLLDGQKAADPGPVLGQLCLSQTREALQAEPDVLPLDRLHEMIHKDYRMLRYLLEHAAGLSLRPLEHYLLILDYRAVDVWYLLTRRISNRQAQRALQEMTSVLRCIACKMGERAISASEA